MKRIFALLLTLAMLFSFATEGALAGGEGNGSGGRAGVASAIRLEKMSVSGETSQPATGQTNESAAVAGNAATPGNTPAQASENASVQAVKAISAQSAEPPADEYERALWYGFVPPALVNANPDSTTVTWAQYCDMLGRMIAAYEEGQWNDAVAVGDESETDDIIATRDESKENSADPSGASNWQRMTASAPDTDMRRDGAMVALLFAAKTLGMASFNAEPPAAFGEYAGRVWECATMDYPVFAWDTPIDLGEGCSDNNHVGPAYDFCLRRVSVQSGESLLTFDDHGDLRLEQPLTLREAALSALRLYESEYGEFVSSVSNETLKLAEDMPVAVYDHLPRWHGYTVPPRMWWYSAEERETYAEEEIALYASFGFNFLRAPLLTEELFIDGDVSKPNRTVFNRLDELLTYAAKYGVHICMDLHTMPGFTTNETDDDDILFDDEATQELFTQIWKTIAEYFREVPSNLLSFNLLNEPHPHTDGELTDEIYSAVMQKAIDTIREQSPERLIIASGVGVSWAEPCEGLAASKIAQGTSVYFLNNGADMWPLYYINKNMNGAEGDLMLCGSFPAGSTVAISVMQYTMADYELFADDTLIAAFSVAGDNFSENGITVKDGSAKLDWEGSGGAYGWYTLEVSIPEACAALRLAEKAGRYYEIYSILVKTPATNYAIMANDVYVSSQTPPALTLNADGTVEAQAADTLFAMNENSLAAMMEKYVRFTERTGQECMLLEFGFNSTIPYDVALCAADAFFNAAERCGLSWCSWYDDFGPMINYEAALAHIEVSGGDDYRRTDAEYTALDDRYSYLPELMAVYQKHMLSAGNASASEPAITDAPESASSPARGQTANPEAPDAEVQKAIAVGLVPQEIQGDYDAPITFRQYSEMLSNLIRLWDESRLAQWDATVAAAAQSNDEMHREDGILEIAYAMVLMGENAPDDFYDDFSDGFMQQLNEHQGEPSWDYPLFPGWEDVGFEWCQSSFMWGGYLTCAIKVSKASLRPIYPYDEETKSAHFQNVLTRAEAITAVLRLAQTDPAILEPEGVYLSVKNVGGYDKSIITDELLAASSKLPTPTQQKLPSEWKGAGLSCSKDGHHDYRDFRETDIKFLADNGFNFARIFFGFDTLRFPDYPEDGRLVNQTELKELDQLIAWGIEYGVHIQISMGFYPDEGGNCKLDGSMPANDAEWALVSDYWTMLARRYAGISSTYLSFDLCNEIQPEESGILEAKMQLSTMLAAMREADTERVLLYSMQGNPHAAWVEATASLGLAIGCHPYYPQYITTTGFEYVENNPYAEPLWPLPWFPMGKISEGRAPLTLQGELGGATLSLHVLNSNVKASLDVYADDTLLEHITLSGGTVENGECYYKDILFSVSIPEGTSEVKVWVMEPHAYMDTLLVEGSFGKVCIVPHDAGDYMDNAEPLPLVINADGTYTNSENRIIDGEEIYRADILPYLEIANKYSVGFMIGEFGIFGSNVYWDISIVAAYHDSVLEMLEKHDLGWCCCELYNVVPKHLVMYNTGEFQWANTTEEEMVVACDDGETRTYTVNRELLDTFRKYTAEGLPASEPAATDTPESASPPAPEQPADQAEQAQPVKSAPPPADEYERAVWYGFVPEEIQGDYDEPITFRQYSEMLSSLIRLCNESRLAQWEATVAAAAQSDDEMRREDGILEIAYAMVLMGEIGQSNDSERIVSVQSIMESGAEGLSGEYPLFPGWEETAFEWCQGNYIWGGIITCATRLSAISGLPIFPLESEADFTRLQEPLTRKDAICAALRLYESKARPVSIDEVAFTEADAWEAKFLSMAEERKRGILENNEAAPCTGTAYYVSNSGDDANDGRSPETAWATIDRVNNSITESGDAVYFERGGLWRGSLAYRENITYSAYGTGDKPKIYGSPENGAGGDKWSLYSEEGGARVWAYNHTIPECGGIVLGDTDTVAKRVFSWYDGKSHYFTEDTSEPFDITKALYTDLSFYCAYDLPESALPLDPRLYLGECTLYLRCDEGNPGELYPSIEFMCQDKSTPVGMIQVANGMIDNLCIMYFAATAIEANVGSTVQNCEIAYGADGCFEYFMPENPGNACVWTDGNAIHFATSDITIRNNFIHDIEGHGINFEIGGDFETNAAQMPYSGVVISGNIIERVGAPMYIANNQDGLDDAVAFDGVAIENNYYVCAGYGWYEECLSNINPSNERKLNFLSLNFGGRPNVGEHTVRVADNVFYRAVNSLVCTVGQTDDIPIFKNNVFAQAFDHVVIWTAAMEVYAALPGMTQEQVAKQYNDAGTVFILRP